MDSSFNPFAHQDLDANNDLAIRVETASTGPTVEAAETAPIQYVPKSRSNWNPFDEIENIESEAARAVASGDSQRAARLRFLSSHYSITRSEAMETLDLQEERFRREQAKKSLIKMPATSQYFTEHPADAPIFSADLGQLGAIESAIGRINSAPVYEAKVDPRQGEAFNPYGDRRAEPLWWFGEEESTGDPALDRKLAMSRTGWERLGQDIGRGFNAGVASARQSAMWGRVMRGELDPNSVDFRDRNAAYDAEIQRTQGEEGFLYNAAQFAGSMVGSAPEAIPMATTTAAVGLGYGLAASTLGLPALGLAALVGMASTAGWWDASNRVESGASYKSMLDAGVNATDARRIASVVGYLNATVETAFTGVAGAAAKPLATRFASKFVPKLAAGLQEQTVGRQLASAARVWGIGTVSETTTEVLQEAVSMAGEQLARITSDANFDPATLDSVVDRLADTAVAAFQGAAVLGGIGAGGAAIIGMRKVSQAQQSREFFETVSENVRAMQSTQVAPDAVHDVIAKQIEGTQAQTTYVDGAAFAQAMADAGVSREQLQEAAPGIAEQIDAAVDAGTDVEIPTAEYASKIAPTALGERLLDHVRLAPDALSFADTVQLQRSYREMQKSIVRGTFGPEEQGRADRFLNSVESGQWRDETKRIEDRLAAQIKGAHPTFSDAEARGQAKLGATMTALLASRANVPVNQLEFLAPKIVGGQKATLAQVDKFEMQRRSYQFDRELERWRNGDGEASFDLGAPSWVLQLFGVSPDAPISARREQFVHVLFPKGTRDLVGEKTIDGKHNLSAEDLKGILVGIQQPLAVFESGKSRQKMRAIVVLTELQRKGTDGNDRNLIVPIRLTVRKGGQELVLNDVLSVYEKARFGEDWFAEGRLLGYEKTKGLEAVLRLRRSISFTADSSRPASTGVASRPVADESLVLPSNAIVFENETSVGDLYQDNRGGFSPASNAITLTPNADLSTFSHEMGHWYLTNLFELSKLDGVDQTIIEDRDALLKEFGIESLEAWDALGTEGQRKYHERFASWTELYFATGKAPVSGLQKFFNRLKRWIVSAYVLATGGAEAGIAKAYRSQIGEDLPPISDEVRRVLDRMVASERMLDEALAAEGLKPLFDEKPADMPDAVWQEMQIARDDAEARGVEELDAARAKDEKWLINARSKELKKIQAKGKEIRDEVRRKVEIDVNSRPEMVALDVISAGNRSAVSVNLKMDPEAVRSLGFNVNQIARMRALGLIKAGGVTPKEAMEGLRPFARFNNPKKMLAALIRAGDRNQIIEDETTASVNFR